MTPTNPAARPPEIGSAGSLRPCRCRTLPSPPFRLVDLEPSQIDFQPHGVAPWRIQYSTTRVLTFGDCLPPRQPMLARVLLIAVPVAVPSHRRTTSLFLAMRRAVRSTIPPPGVAIPGFVLSFSSGGLDLSVTAAEDIVPNVQVLCYGVESIVACHSSPLETSTSALGPRFSVGVGAHRDPPPWTAPACKSGSVCWILGNCCRIDISVSKNQSTYNVFHPPDPCPCK